MRSPILVSAVLLAACQNDYGITDAVDVPEVADTAMIDSTMTETYTVSGAPADIVFYGDTSYSMQSDLLRLGDDIDSFADMLASLAADWQLAAVTGPDGCAVDGVFRADSPDWVERFSTAIRTAPADDSQDEMGLQNVAHALELTGPGDCNEGLLRPEASLHVIFVSDENDESPGFDGSDDYWRTYVDRIVAAKGDASLVRISAVAGPVPDGCGAADPGTGYDGAVTATNGAFLPICEDWGANLPVLADVSVVQDTFVLTEPADPDTIEVTIDGEPVDTWAWYAPDNAVVFVENAPRGGQVITIHYEVVD